jgi:hypothetical protein
VLSSIRPNEERDLVRKAGDIVRVGFVIIDDIVWTRHIVGRQGQARRRTQARPLDQLLVVLGGSRPDMLPSPAIARHGFVMNLGLAGIDVNMPASVVDHHRMSK